jgi:hypothetical protein
MDPCADTRGLAENLLVNAERGQSVSWLDNYPNLINSITLEQVHFVSLGAVRSLEL